MKRMEMVKNIIASIIKADDRVEMARAALAEEMQARDVIVDKMELIANENALSDITVILDSCPRGNVFHYSNREYNFFTETKINGESCVCPECGHDQFGMYGPLDYVCLKCNHAFD